MRRVVAVALLLVVSGAFAQPGATAVKAAVRTYSEAEVLSMAGLGNVTKPVSWGSVVRYGGGLLTLGTLVYAALEWFYDTAQESTGTDLDDWGFGISSGGLAFACLIYVPQFGTGSFSCHVGSSWSSGPVLGSGSITASSPPTELDWATVYDQVYAGWSGAAGEFTRVDVWVNPGEAGCSQGGLSGGQYARCYRVLGRPDLEDILATSSEARNALRSQVVPSYLSHLEQGPQWPFTYAQPYGGAGIELDPAPNRNQWYDNPYANPELDTDNDGWEDWKEVVTGTDPNDPDSYPTIDPAPGGGGLPDTDGDGVPDEYDPCRFDAQNRCADGPSEPDPALGEGLAAIADAVADVAAQVEQGNQYAAQTATAAQQTAENTERIAVAVEGIEIPDDYTREPTQQQVLSEQTRTADEAQRTADAAEEILAELQEPAEAPSPDATGPELEPVTEPSLSFQAWESVATQVEVSVTGWWDTAKTRFPFALGIGWLPTSLSVGSGSCTGAEMTILGTPQEVGLCGTPMDDWLATTGRTALLGLVLVAFYMASAQVVTRL